jgi:hypothetical protein
MSLSYDGSLLYHLAAHMPPHCIIIVAPPSCPFVPLACCCLLCHLCHLHLCCTSLFWLIVVFNPLSCLLLPPSPKESLSPYAPLQTRLVLHPTPLVHFFCCAGWLLHNTLPLLLASLPLLCPCQCPCCAGIIAVVALASLPSLPPTLPSSIAAVKQIFAAHPSIG